MDVQLVTMLVATIFIFFFQFFSFFLFSSLRPFLIKWLKVVWRTQYPRGTTLNRPCPTFLNPLPAISVFAVVGQQMPLGPRCKAFIALNNKTRQSRIGLHSKIFKYVNIWEHMFTNVNLCSQMLAYVHKC